MMLVFGAHNCDSSRKVEVENLGCGAGRIRCLECHGTGKCQWPVEMTGLVECVDCKGSGYILVSI